MRRLCAAIAAAAVLASAGCSGGESGGDAVSGDRADAKVAGKDARELAEVRRLFDAVPKRGELADASVGAFCDANRRATGVNDFVLFRQAVSRIEPVLPDDMPKRPRTGFGILLHTLNGADDRAGFRRGVRALDDDARALVQTYKAYGDRTCGRLAPDAEALA